MPHRTDDPTILTDPTLTSPTDSISRRRFLQAAGGLTFLALVPIGGGLFAAAADGKEMSGDLPIFNALPYIQPGASSKLVDGQEAMVLAWQTNPVPAKFDVTYGPDRGQQVTATIAQATRMGAKSEGDNRVNYAAQLVGLNLAARYRYTVTMNGEKIAEGYFTTRKKRGMRTRFVSFGDNSYGEPGQRAIAYYAYKAQPDFVMNTGDNVYESGLDNEYTRYFFPIYNAEFAHPSMGAPILRSVPFYTVIANHDVAGKDANKHPVADFAKSPDSLGYYTNMYLPMNGPASPTQPTPVSGENAALDSFRQAAGPRFPQMANYSFDYGDAHFLCLDSNHYIDPTDSALQSWISDDLAQTDALWKFVVYHHPAFNVGNEHYAEQHMRVISPILEAHGVDFVLHGHEHVYERSMPLHFVPGDTTQAAAVGEGHRMVPGTFKIDTAFDGKSATQPDGVIYITTGAGGKHLYDPGFDTAPDQWLHPEDNNVAWCSMFHSAYHSFTTFDLNGRTLTMTQTDELGREVDRIMVTKKA